VKHEIDHNAVCANCGKKITEHFFRGGGFAFLCENENMSLSFAPTLFSAARATIEKQRKVIEWFAIRAIRMCWICNCCINKGGDCYGTPEAHCTTGVIAYAEKRVEEGR
jgi:hypothetical protein